MVAGRRRRRLRGTGPRVPSLQATWRPAGSGAHGDVAGLRQLDFHGAFAVAGGWLGRARRLLGELEPGPEHGWLAFFEGYIASGRAIATGRSSSLVEAAEIGRRLEVPTWRCSASHWRAPRWWLARRSRGHAPSRRGDRGGARGRGRRSRSRARGPAASWSPRARRCATTSARRSGVTGSPSSPSATGAGTCSRSAAPSTARCTSGAGDWARRRRTVLEASVEDFSRSRPAMVGGPLAALAELRRRQGRSGGSMRLLRQAGASPIGTALPGAARARSRTDTSRGRACRAGCFASCPSIASWIGHRRWSCWSARGSLAESSTRRTPTLESLREIERLVGTAPLRASARSRRRTRRGRKRRARSRHGRCSRTPSTASSAPAGATTPRARGSSLPPASTRSGAPTRHPRRRPPARPRCATSARSPKPSGRGACSAPSGPMATLGARIGHTTRARGAVSARGRADESRDRRAAGRQRAHRPPPRDQHPAQARPPVTNRSGGARRAPRPARPTRRRSQTWPSDRR